MENIADIIKKLSPLMDESSEIFRELSIFFGAGSKVDVHQGDLAKFLGHKRLYRVIRLRGESYKDCVYQLVDDHPESMEALGMLRYYRAPAGKIKWEEIEKAETAIGNELTTNAYGWMPDAWTVFEADLSKIPDQVGDDGNTQVGDDRNTHELVAILAFDFGD